MKVTNVKMFNINNPNVRLANGTVTLDNVLNLKFGVLKGKSGNFISWDGTTQFTYKNGEKAGQTGYASPIFITDETLRKEVDAAILNKFNGNSTTTTQTENTTPAANNDFTADDIPF